MLRDHEPELFGAVVGLILGLVVALGISLEKDCNSAHNDHRISAALEKEKDDN